MEKISLRFQFLLFRLDQDFQQIVEDLHSLMSLTMMKRVVTLVVPQHSLALVPKKYLDL